MAQKMGTTGSSTMLWSTQCELVDAACSPDHFVPGTGALVRRQPYDRAYEFSNGRRFRDRRNPYESFEDNP